MAQQLIEPRSRSSTAFVCWAALSRKATKVVRLVKGLASYEVASEYIDQRWHIRNHGLAGIVDNTAPVIDYPPAVWKSNSSGRPVIHDVIKIGFRVIHIE